MSDFVSESGHWYYRDGKPCYSLIGKNGLERPTTLRDARKLALVPSVTTISRLMAAPALERWKSEQVLLAALTLPRRDEEIEKAWLTRVHEDSRAQALKAADRGTAIHTTIARLLRGLEVEAELAPFAQAAIDLVHQTYPGLEWASECSFASPLGFGGAVDLHSKIGVVVDFKSKDGDLGNVKCYDEHYMQAAAYAQGLGMPEASCANVFVSRELPARAIIIQHTREDIIRGWRMFAALLELFKAKTGLGE